MLLLKTSPSAWRASSASPPSAASAAAPPSTAAPAPASAATAAATAALAARSLRSSSSLSRRRASSASPSATPASPAAPAAAAAALAALALSLASAFGPSLPPALAFAPVKNSPFANGKKPLALGPTPDGSVRACEGNLIPNCVSTASTNDLYAPPWRAPLSVQEAARALERAVAATDPTAVLVQSTELPSGHAYRAWQVAGVYGADIFEVVIKPERRAASASAAIDGPGLAAAAATAATATEGGGGSGGLRQQQRAPEQQEASALVTYRSSATTAKYLYPFQVVLSDGDAQRKRVRELRAAANFSLVGCTGYIECYSESAGTGDVFPFSFPNDQFFLSSKEVAGIWGISDADADTSD